MGETITTFVGLDAHAESSAIGFAEAGRAAPRFVGTVGPKFAELSKALAKLGDPSKLLIVYEAGPCGYALARELRRAGYRCEVVAPSKVPRRPGDRVKTDRRDAATWRRCPLTTAPRALPSWSIARHTGKTSWTAAPATDRCNAVPNPRISV